MYYKTVVISNANKAKEMAAAVEAESEKMAQNGYTLVTMSVLNSGKAVLVFKADPTLPQEITPEEEQVEAENQQ